MSVIVQPGFALCNGCMKLEETQRTLAVQASNAMYDRIDTVVLRLNDNDDARICDLYIVEGVPATSPVRPALQRTESIFEIGLADLFIAKNSSAISNQRITDTRYETERCGIISSISQFDTTTLYKQIQADLTGFKEVEQTEFLEWFEHIKNKLDEDMAGNLQNQIDELKEGDTQNNTVSFGSIDALDSETVPLKWTDVELLESEEKHRSIFGKISAMFKNIRFLKKKTDEIDSSLSKRLIIPETAISVICTSNVVSETAEFSFISDNSRISSFHCYFEMNTSLTANGFMQVCTFTGGGYPARNKMTVPLVVMNANSVPLGMGILTVDGGLMHMISNIAVEKGYIIRGTAVYVR